MTPGPPDLSLVRRDLLLRQRFLRQGSTNPMSVDDWVASLVPSEAADVLEVGSGWGSFALRFLDLRSESVKRFLATDADEETCAVLGLTLASQAPIAAVERADPLDLSKYRESFHAVVCVDQVHQLSDPAKGIAEMLAALRPGGFCVAVAPHRDDMAELWTLVRTFDPSFPPVSITTAFDSESAPPVLDALDRPWELFDYENVLEVSPEATVEFVETFLGPMGIRRDAEWSAGLARFLAGWSGEFVWAVQRRAGFVVA